MGKVVDFGRDIYCPLRKSVGIKVMFFVCDVKIWLGSLGRKFYSCLKFLLFDPPVAFAIINDKKGVPECGVPVSVINLSPIVF